jgi:hypothetical protein
VTERNLGSGMKVHMPRIPATWEVEVGLGVQGQKTKGLEAKLKWSIVWLA